MNSESAAVTANKITKGILLAISEAYPRTNLVFRVNVLVARVQRGTVRSVPNGTADLIGCVCGVPVCIEVKAGRDQLSGRQVAFRDAWVRAGGLYVEARSVDRAMREIADAVSKRKAPREIGA